MCLDLILNHFVLIFLKDGCPLPPSSTKWHNHRNEKTLTWEDEYLDQQHRFRDLMIIKRERNRPNQKKSQTKLNLFCATLPKKQSKDLKLLGKMKKIQFHLGIMSGFLSVLIFFVVEITLTYFLGSIL